MCVDSLYNYKNILYTGSLFHVQTDARLPVVMKRRGYRCEIIYCLSSRRATNYRFNWTDTVLTRRDHTKQRGHQLHYQSIAPIIKNLHKETMGEIRNIAETIQLRLLGEAIWDLKHTIWEEVIHIAQQTNIDAAMNQ